MVGSIHNAFPSYRRIADRRQMGPEGDGFSFAIGPKCFRQPNHLQATLREFGEVLGKTRCATPNGL